MAIRITKDKLESIDIEIISQATGQTSGYTSGGYNPPLQVNTIEKFSFSTDGNATDVGDLTQARSNAAGQSSTVSGYTSGGAVSPSPTYTQNIIDKFPFAVDGNATDVGDLTQSRYFMSGQTAESYGYTSGGSTFPSPPPTLTNVIDKFPFAADANATDVGDLTLARSGAAGQSSLTHGYTSGGATNIIDKFSFASDGDATDVGDLSRTATQLPAGQNSLENGYTSGGFAPLASDTIDKFPFAADANATDVGNLSLARYRTTGQSSTVSGYTSGGRTAPGGRTNTIDKFPFATDANATDVGDLTQARDEVTGQQV